MSTFSNVWGVILLVTWQVIRDRLVLDLLWFFTFNRDTKFWCYFTHKISIAKIIVNICMIYKNLVWASTSHWILVWIFIIPIITLGLDWLRAKTENSDSSSETSS
jgi:hypothetical protein